MLSSGLVELLPALRVRPAIRLAWPSPLRASLGHLAHSVSQTFEVNAISRRGGCSGGTGQKQSTQVQPILIFADQFAHILTAGAETTLADLFIHEGLQRVG